ncbi:MAG: hypothetical protein IT580_21395 [Verrucomicrobiales bacterium]|nr:hypothetical protein [Verrucomicrobiales bacterium]
MLGILAMLGLVCVTVDAATVGVERRANGTVGISATAGDEEVVVVERSADFTGWEEWVTGHGPLDSITDQNEGVPWAGRFYRVRTRPKTNGDDWKNTVRAQAEEPFQSEIPPFGSSAPRWIKFLLPLDGSRRVFFQDSGRYTFHYDFAVARVAQFKGISRTEFDRVTLQRNGQQAVLGALLFSPAGLPNEVGIQIAGQEAFAREEVADWIASVRAMIQAPDGLDLYYMPTLEQQEVALKNADWFRTRGIEVGSAARWVVQDECYASGWALGRMVFVTASEIRAAAGSGRLGPDDILLTDLVPAEVPPVAGIVSLAPATPNSHVALLARAYGIPFVHLTDAGAEARLRGWDGHDVAMRASALFGGCQVSVDALSGEVDPVVRREILELKAAPALEIPARAVRGAVSMRVEDSQLTDIRYIGGKAANLGVLRRSIPQASPTPVIAFTFDLWEGYLQQVVEGGPTLANWIAERLGAFTWPPSMAALQDALATVRTRIRSGTDFSAAQKQAILAALQEAGFEPGRRIRFRSSTNVEDSEQFSGAGLYDSYSGCLADDLDDDDEGPSRCEPSEANERGVFRALRRVYASFYNDNAFLERLRHRVDESKVGMAVLVHYSTPDEDELANGVATMEVRKDEFSRAVSANLVSQVGAESVTNPDQAARPEEMRLTQFTEGSPFVEKVRESGRVPLGGTVLTWQSEYLDLFRLLDRAAVRWAEEVPGSEWFLDFEYKKESPGVLRVKQIRPIPRPKPVKTGPPWMVNVERDWVVYQGEHSDLLAAYRLKSWWTFQTRMTRLNVSNLASSVLTQVAGTWREGDATGSYTGRVAELPGRAFRAGSEFNEDSWRTATGKRTLRVEREPYVPEGGAPLTDLGDLRLEFAVEHVVPQPVPEIPPFFEPGPVRTVLVTQESVMLTPRSTVSAGSKRQRRSWKQGGRTMEIEYYWPPEPKGIVAGYTAPLQRWEGTTLTGFTSRPIVLRGELSQTYRPGHHNFWEDFLFDPWLEPGVAADLLEELRGANIRAILAGGDREALSSLIVLGWDGQFRELK